MDKHYFVGIPMPEYIQPIAIEKQEEYQLRHYYKAIPHPADLHITLLFIGGFPQDKLPTMKEQLKRVSSNHQPFTLQIDGVSSFGSNHSPRVIYLSVQDSEPLKQLNREIVEQAGSLLNTSKKERFTPHVTIAKKWIGVDGFAFEKQPFSPIQIDVNSFNLFEINPSRSPKYTPIETFEL